MLMTMKLIKFMLIGSLIVSLPSCKCNDCDNTIINSATYVYRNETTEELLLKAINDQGDTIRNTRIYPGNEWSYSFRNREISGPLGFSESSRDSMTTQVVIKWPSQSRCLFYDKLAIGEEPIFTRDRYTAKREGNMTRYTFTFTQQALDTAQVCP